MSQNDDVRAELDAIEDFEAMMAEEAAESSQEEPEKPKRQPRNSRNSQPAPEVEAPAPQAEVPQEGESSDEEDNGEDAEEAKALRTDKLKNRELTEDIKAMANLPRTVMNEMEVVVLKEECPSREGTARQKYTWPALLKGVADSKESGKPFLVKDWHLAAYADRTTSDGKKYHQNGEGLPTIFISECIWNKRITLRKPEATS